MSLYAFTAAKPILAAAELRDAGYDAFALLMMDRRTTHRHKVAKPGAKASKWKPLPIVALKGYVFAHDVDPWKLHSMRHVRQAVKFCGHWQPIPPKQAAWLLNPPAPLFHDTDIPRYLNRPAPPVVKRGDKVSVTLACEQIGGEVVSVSTDGHTLMMRLNRLMAGRDTITVPVSMVEAAA